MCERKMRCKTSGMSLHRTTSKQVRKHCWSPACFPNDGHLLINENNKSVQLELKCRKLRHCVTH